MAAAGLGCLLERLDPVTGVPVAASPTCPHHCPLLPGARHPLWHFAPARARGALDPRSRSLQSLMAFLPVCPLSPRLQEGGEHAEPRERQAGGGGAAAALRAVQRGGGGGRGPRAARPLPGRGEPATPGPLGSHSCHCRCPCSLARACPTAVTTTRTSTMTRTMATRWAPTMPTRMMSSSAAGEAAGR